MFKFDSMISTGISAGNDLLEKLERRPVMKWSQVYWLALPVGIWFVLFQLRPYLMRLDCTRAPESCRMEGLPLIDQWFFQESASKNAELLSDYLQNGSGVLVLLFPLLMEGWRRGPFAWHRVWPEWMLLFFAAAWNGVLMEVVRLSVQRPRPYVLHRLSEGGVPSAYTSFYSGHTSFSALAMTLFFVSVYTRGAPRWVLIGGGVLGFLWTALTGFARVFSSHHFFTDILVGAFAGSSVAIAVSLWVRSGQQTEKLIS